MRCFISTLPVFTFFVLALNILLLAQPTVAAVATQTPPEQKNVSIYHQQTAFGYAGPMAVFQLANNWSGRLRDGDDGFLFYQSEQGVRVNNWSLAYVKRLHAQYRMSAEAAEIFYAYSQDLEYSNPLQTQADISAKDYRGEGFKLSYRWPFQFNNLLSDFSLLGNLQPQLTWLKLDDITWGSWRGDLSYQSRDQWDLDLDVDYYYQQDKLLRRGEDPQRPLDKSYGDFYSLGLGADMRLHWQSEQLNWQYALAYQGENLAATIDWSELPTTQARISTTGAFFLFGIESEQDKQLEPDSTHYLQQQLGCNCLASRQLISLTLDSYRNAIYQNHSLGLSWAADQSARPAWQLGVARSLATGAPAGTASWQLRALFSQALGSATEIDWGLRFQSQSLNASYSRNLNAQLTAAVHF